MGSQRAPKQDFTPPKKQQMLRVWKKMFWTMNGNLNGPPTPEGFRSRCRSWRIFFPTLPFCFLGSSGRPYGAPTQRLVPYGSKCANGTTVHLAAPLLAIRVTLKVRKQYHLFSQLLSSFSRVFLNESVIFPSFFVSDPSPTLLRICNFPILFCF